MTYVTEQTSQELRSHMRRLKGMAGWHEPLADRLYKEILELDAQRDALQARLDAMVPLTDEEVDDIWADCSDPNQDEIDIQEFARDIQAAIGIKALEMK